MEGKVTFAKALGIIFLICALFILFVSFSIGPSLNTITGVVLAVVAIVYMVNPVVTYDSSGFKTKNLWGMTLKTYTFSADKFDIRDRNIYVNGKKVRLSKGMLVQKEYQGLLDHVASNAGSVTKEETKKSKMDDDILDSEMIDKEL